MIRQRIGDHYCQRYITDPERPAFLQELRRHEIGGRPIADVLDSITAVPLDSVRSVAAVLHGREKSPPRPGATRPPGLSTGCVTADVRAVDTELDRRPVELGEPLAAEAPRWAVEAWGRPPAESRARRCGGSLCWGHPGPRPRCGRRADTGLQLAPDHRLHHGSVVGQLQRADARGERLRHSGPPAGAGPIAWAGSVIPDSSR
jgi:hypothetical protein